MTNKNYPDGFYHSWQAMKFRCNNKNYEHRHRYSDRGITYDLKWDTVEGFAEDMLDSWENGLTLERLDNNKNYCKDNCCWVDTNSFQNGLK